MRRSAAASVAALLALGVVAGTGTFLATSDDSAAPVVTTTTSVVARPASPDEVAAAIAGSLRGNLEVQLTAAEAECVAGGMLQAIGPERAGTWATDAPGALTADEEDALVRVVVDCLPDVKATALLGDPTTTTIAGALPDE